MISYQLFLRDIADLTQPPHGTRSSSWLHMQFMLYLVCVHGISLRVEISDICARAWGVERRGGGVKNAFTALENNCLLHIEKVALFGGQPYQLVQLSTEGRGWCNMFGWDVAESEWERIQRMHAGDSQPRHTTLILAFAYHARRLGWDVSVLPDIDRRGLWNLAAAQRVQPDVLIKRDARQVYVECEVRARQERADRWPLADIVARQLGGELGICALRPRQRIALEQICSRQHIVVDFMTDLDTLSRGDGVSIVAGA